MLQDENKTVPYAIRKLLETLGEETLFETEGPGVYYMADTERWEFYIVEQTSPIISEEAKSYGKQHPDYAGLLFYSIEDIASGYTIIKYELVKYAIDNGISDHDSKDLHAIAAFGAEDHPEYFGAYPVPIYTPWGYTTRYQRLENGVFWLETDQREEALTMCYCIWSTVLTKEAIKLGVMMECDQKDGIDVSLGYIFFKKPDACIPIFETMRSFPKLKQNERITIPALMNAIWQNHPDYAYAHNAREQLGLNDGFCYLLKQFGIESAPNISVDNMIALSPEAGVEYIRF